LVIDFVITMIISSHPQKIQAQPLFLNKISRGKQINEIT
jgi:hypothetical protein